MNVRSIIPAIVVMALATGFGAVGIDAPASGHPAASVLASGECDGGPVDGSHCSGTHDTSGADGFSERPHGNSMLTPGNHYEGSPGSPGGN